MVLERFTILNFKLHSRTMNFVMHVQYYRWVMSLYKQNDALLCKVLPARLDEGVVA